MVDQIGGGRGQGHRPVNKAPTSKSQYSKGRHFFIKTVKLPRVSPTLTQTVNHPHHAPSPRPCTPVRHAGERASTSARTEVKKGQREVQLQQTQALRPKKRRTSCGQLKARQGRSEGTTEANQRNY